MGKTIYYLTSDFVASDDFHDLIASGNKNNVEVLEKLCDTCDAVKYSSVEEFIDAFNSEYISDLGYLIYI